MTDLLTDLTAATEGSPVSSKRKVCCRWWKLSGDGAARIPKAGRACRASGRPAHHERIDHDHAQPRPDRSRRRQIGIRPLFDEQHLDRRHVGLNGAEQFRSGHNPALLTGGGPLSIFRHQPITPQRRLAGCDAEACKLRHSTTVDEVIGVMYRPEKPAPHNTISRSSARPASLSWAAAASRACEPFEVSRVTGLTNARYADGQSAPTRVPQSFPLVAV